MLECILDIASECFYLRTGASKHFCKGRDRLNSTDFGSHTVSTPPFLSLETSHRQYINEQVRPWFCRSGCQPIWSEDACLRKFVVGFVMRLDPPLKKISKFLFMASEALPDQTPVLLSVLMAPCPAPLLTDLWPSLPPVCSLSCQALGYLRTSHSCSSCFKSST